MHTKPMFTTERPFAVARPRWPLLSLLLAGCTAADNLSYDELVTEFDGIVTVAGNAPDRRIDYAESAPVSAWYMRQFWLVPLRWPLGWVFGVRHTSKLDNPSRHVRELLVELPDETGSGYDENAQCLLRMGWIAALDSSVASRIVALDGLATSARRLALPVLEGSPEELLAPPDPTGFQAAREAVQAGRPEIRQAATWDDAKAAAYGAALEQLVAAPLADVASRLLLAQDLGALLQAEPSRELRDATRAALTVAMTYAVRGILLDIVRGRDPRWSDLRLCGMQQFRSLGGPSAVPLLLALMAAGPEQVARGEPRFDPDPLVRLRLINYCGQLSGELALEEVRLPGAEQWEGIAPADFLAQTILTEQSYYSKLRVPALTALNLCLQRPHLDYDIAWVKAWVDERPSRRRT
ncbi:MAG: hypothetical protein H6838_17060 [Planctomycetes bacterium]|nr:hypothetical protein [Planctomycetota bacterium]MCB9887203.1 hypothetical protein [Planctomycetota bacterium]